MMGIDENLVAVRLERLLARELGLAPSGLRGNLLGAIRERTKRLGVSELEYVTVAGAGDAGAVRELAALADHLLLGHTHFYRHETVWRWLEDNLVRELGTDAECGMRNAEPRRFGAPPASPSGGPTVVRALAAGCSTGEEAYTLALLLRRMFGDNGYHVTGVDMSERALRVAARGEYPASEVAALPEAWRAGALAEAEPGISRFVERIRCRIDLQWRNLLTGQVEGPFHVVCLRNVLTYMEEPAVERILGAIEKLLARPGVLVTAPQEAFLVASRPGLKPAGHGLPVFVSAPGGGRGLHPPDGGVCTRLTAGSAPGGGRGLHPPDGGVCDRLRLGAEYAGRGSAEWVRFEGELVELMKLPAGQVEIDLSQVKGLDYHVKRSLRSAVKLLAAGGWGVRVISDFGSSAPDLDRHGG